MIRTSTNHSRSHRQVSAELNNIGVVLHKKKKWCEAAEVYKEALKIMLEKVDQNCCKTGEQQKPTSKLQSMHSTFFQSRNTSLPSTAAKFHADGEPVVRFECLNFSDPLAIDLSESQMDEDSSVSVVVIFNLALCHLQYGKPQRAEKLFHMALSQSFGQHVTRPSTRALLKMSIHHNLGVIYAQQGRYDQSAQQFMASLWLGNDAFGRNILTAATLTKLGGVFLAVGDVQQAMMAFNGASNIYDHYKLETAQSDKGVASAA